MDSKRTERRDTKLIPCKFLAQHGACRNPACRFNHDLQSNAQQPPPPHNANRTKRNAPYRSPPMMNTVGVSVIPPEANNNGNFISFC